jgi:large subunit ribosomal protein L21
MYSVIVSGGFQHKVTPGERVKLSKINAPVGEVLTVSDVLLFANGSTVKVGAPKVADATVKLEVLQHDRGDKVRVFKKKRRKRYRKTQGHRQHFTEVIVREISCGGESASAEETVVKQARVRAAALEKMKLQIKKPTRREKIAADAKKG